MRNYALQNKYEYHPNHTLILPFTSSEIIKEKCYKLQEAVIGRENDIGFTMGFYHKEQAGLKSLFVINNTHVDLPCFLTKKYSSFSFIFDEFTIRLNAENNFHLIGRPEKLIKKLFTEEVCKAISRIYDNSKCIYIEGLSEYMFLLFRYHLKPKEFDNIKNAAIALSSLFALNEEFNTDHID